MKFTTISKIPNKSQMLIIPFLSMYYNRVTNIKFHVNPSNGSRADAWGETDGQTDKNRQMEGRTGGQVN